MKTAWDIYESPWPNKQLDRTLRCQQCGQLLGRPCRLDGCGEQIQQEAQLCDNEPPQHGDSRVMPKGSRGQEAERRPGSSDTGT